MRLFIGIVLPQTYTRRLGMVIEKLNHDYTGTWVKMRNLHLTVTFLGEVPDSELIKLRKLLRQVVGQASGFKLELGQVVGIPAHNPRLLAIKVATNAPARALQQQLQIALRQVKLAPRINELHLTLGRLKQRLPQIPNVELPPHLLKVSELWLVQSTLTPGGPNYRHLERLKLKQESGPGPLRENVAICVVNEKNEILLVRHRDHYAEAWQLPQGGVVPGDSLIHTAARELQEEVGLIAGKILSISPRVYRYVWPKQLRQQGTDPDKQGYIGQEQSLVVMRIPEARPRLSPDPREATETRWVAATDLLTALSPVRRKFGTIIVAELKRLGIVPVHKRAAGSVSPHS